MLNITTVSQVWNCLLRPINKTALTCARNAANSGFWIEPQIMKRGWSCIVIHWGHAMCWFSYKNKTKQNKNLWSWWIKWFRSTALPVNHIIFLKQGFYTDFSREVHTTVSLSYLLVTLLLRLTILWLIIKTPVVNINGIFTSVDLQINCLVRVCST